MPAGILEARQRSTLSSTSATTLLCPVPTELAFILQSGAQRERPTDECPSAVPAARRQQQWRERKHRSDGRGRTAHVTVLCHRRLRGIWYWPPAHSRGLKAAVVVMPTAI